MTERRSTLDVSGLLTIDVASELRKLSLAQLQGPWQIPAELARRAIRDGARRIEITLGRGRARVIDDGAGIVAEHLEWTGILMDPARPNEDRHAALTALEASGELVLLAIAGLGVRTARIASIHKGRRATLQFSAGRPPVLAVSPVTQRDRTEVELSSADLDRRRATEWLSGAARFAPAHVQVDGRKMNVGFVDTYPSAPLHTPLRGHVAIPSSGDTAHVWLLEHGLVTGHVAVPESPCFEAAVELGGRSTELSAARLREAMQPHVGELVNQAIGHLARLGRQAPGMPEPARARFARLVLQAARRGLRRKAIRSVPVFRIVTTDGDRCVDLDTLLSAARAGSTSDDLLLPALYPDQRPDRFAIGSSPVLVADEVERSLLAELYKLRFVPPDLRDGASSLLAMWRRTVFAVSRAGGRVADILRHPLRPKPLPDGSLRPDELAMLGALRTFAARGRHRAIKEVLLCAGNGPVRRVGGQPATLLLPRENPTVAAGVHALATDARWIYPVWLALLDGQGLPPRPVRAQWRNA
jgi:hypothetical protein